MEPILPTLYVEIVNVQEMTMYIPTQSIERGRGSKSIRTQRQLSDLRKENIKKTTRTKKEVDI